MELWRRLVDRVNAVWTASKNKGGHYEEDPYSTSPERSCQQHPAPPPEEAHSDDSSSTRLDQDDQPGPSGTSGQSVTRPQSQPTTEPPPSENTSRVPTQRAHATVPRTRQSEVCPPLQGPKATPQTQDDQGPGVSGSGHTVHGTEAQNNREAGRTAVRQGEDRLREPNLQEALTNILGAYHHFQETMGQILYKLQETQRLQEGQYLGIRDDLKNIYTILVTIPGVLADMGVTMREAVAQQPAPDTSPPKHSPPPSLALVDRRRHHRTNRPPAPHPLQKENHPANGPYNPGRSQRTLPRPPSGIKTLLIVILLSHSVNLSTLNCHSSTSYAPLDNAPGIQIDWTLPWTFLHHHPSPVDIPLYL
ncbi:hypothetical protein NDU88_002685 [Pleurodeles waltl]|uniref:Uncharacterized protein n=1 Tax=Pleurodeles waltl TaxID=8319 RepID=A0AAV7Q7E6_PLEWA|nr:hypothetical protein NDU88_002685 [Pleurodeles waltl]